MRVRRLLLGIVAVISVPACASASADPSSAPELLISPSPTAFTLVTAGQVRGAVPDGWHAALADPELGIRGGFVASPRAGGWPDIDGSAVGMSANSSSTLAIPSAASICSRSPAVWGPYGIERSAGRDQGVVGGRVEELVDLSGLGQPEADHPALAVRIAVDVLR